MPLSTSLPARTLADFFFPLLPSESIRKQGQDTFFFFFPGNPAFSPRAGYDMVHTRVHRRPYILPFTYRYVRMYVCMVVRLMFVVVCVFGYFSVQQYALT